MRDRNTSRIVLYHIAEILSYFHPNHPSRDPAPTITAYDEMQSFFPKQASKDSKSTLYILPFVPSHHGNSIRHPASQLHSRDCTHPPHHIAKTNITARDAIGITGKKQADCELAVSGEEDTRTVIRIAVFREGIPWRGGTVIRIAVFREGIP
ncbi:hypothetical protein QE152_g9800 [Popillia japonica]|uniref:Uncharacterized protein n=1 Tax=Popillia japonica TaxID=7064 RepID=A0AAW1LX65_POPJA